MKQTRRNKALSGLLCMVLTAVTALSVTGCSQTKPESPSTQDGSAIVYEAADTPHQVGEGETTFPFTVVDLEGGEVAFEVATNADTVGEALQEAGLIAGEVGQYGLMVTTVNGQYHVYEEGAYWGFFIDGEYAMSGVDSTPIEAGKTYSLEATKAS